MSSVTETHMEAGDFSLVLREGVPPSISLRLREWGMIVITPAKVTAPGSLTKTQALTAARYVGAVDTYDAGRREIRGTSAISFLGVGEIGSIISSKIERTTATDLNTWLGDLLPANGLSRIAGSGGGVATGSFQYVSRRQALEQLTAATGAEWRLLTDNVGVLGIQGGDAASIFGSEYSNPRAIAIAKQGTREPGALGIRANSMQVQRSATEYVSEVYAIARADGGAEVGYSGGASPYYGPDNLPLTMGKVVDVPDAQRGTAAAVAASTQAALTDGTKSVSIDSDSYSLSAQVRAGACLWVYDLERGLYDKANAIRYQGRYWPAQKLRVLSVRFPITAGMGVYYFSSFGGNGLVDLTPYVVVDSRPSVRLECSANLGLPSRNAGYSSSPTGDLPKAVTLDQWRTWSPVFTQTGTLATSTLSSTMTRLGRKVSGEAHGTGGTGGTAGQAIKLILPVTAAYIANKPVGWWRWYRSAAGQSYGGFLVLSVDGNRAQMNGWTHGPLGNDPNFAPASGDEFYLMLDYEAASS